MPVDFREFNSRRPGFPSPSGRGAGFFVLPLFLACLAGCGVRPVAGGTEGTLTAGGELLGDIQVTVHQVEDGSTQPIGFGVTNRDGWFELVTEGARGPLWLEPGEYRFTLESAGAPVQIPSEYSQAETTPLSLSWEGGDGELELKIASKLPL